MGKNSQSQWKHCHALIGKVTGRHDRYLSRGMISCWSWFLRQLVWWSIGIKEERLVVVRPVLKPDSGDKVVMLVWDQLCAQCVTCVCAMCSVMSDSWWLNGLYIARQAPLSMGFLKQGCWSGLPFLLQGVFLTEGLNPCLLCFLHCRGILYPLSHWGFPSRLNSILCDSRKLQNLNTLVS